MKPFESVELLARVRSMMRIKQMHDSLEEWNLTLEEKVKQQVDYKLLLIIWKGRNFLRIF